MMHHYNFKSEDIATKHRYGGSDCQDITYINIAILWGWWHIKQLANTQLKNF